MNHPQRKRTAYTLVELLVTISFLLLAMNLMFKIFHDLSWSLVRSADQASANNQTLTLSRKWRTFFCDADGKLVVDEDAHTISAGDREVTFRDHQLTFRRGQSQSRFKTRGDAECRFDIERQDNPPANLPVLEISWPEENRQQRTTHRVIAAPPERNKQ